MPNKSELQERIKKHEGCRLSPYKDTEGIWTVGYGRNLEAVPFTQAEVDFMFLTDYDRAVSGASKLPSFDVLTPARRGVLVEMCFQMGYEGVKKFRRFLAASSRSDWQEAHDEMLDSKWAKQTPGRAQELARIFLHG